MLPLVTTLKLELNYREINLNNHLKCSQTEVLRLRIQRSHFETGRRGDDVKQVAPHLPWHLTIRKDISAMEVPQRSMGPWTHTRLCSLESKCGKEEGVKNSGDSTSPGETEGRWKPRAPFRGLINRLAPGHSPWALGEKWRLGRHQRHRGRN